MTEQGLLLPLKILEPSRRQLGAAHGVLDIAVAQVGLQGARVVPLIGERITAGVPQHVRMRLEAQPSRSPCPLNHASKASGGERRAALRREHKRRLGLLFALLSAQCPQFIPEDRVSAWRAVTSS